MVGNLAVALGLFLLLAGNATAASQQRATAAQQQRTMGAPQQDIGSISVSQLQCHSFAVSAHISPSWEPSPNPYNSTYRVYRVGSNSHTLMAESDDLPIHLTSLQEFTPYYIYVHARSRHAGGGGIPLYRKVGELTVVTPHCTVATTPVFPPTPYPPQPGDVRLRHEATGKCLFGHPANGDPVKTWGCWQDPAMAISLEPLGGSEVRIRIRATGRCLFGNPVSGGEVKSWVCWNDPNMVYVREDLTNNRLRLRHKATGQCMYGSPVNGGTVRNWPCWADPNMVWVIDPL